MIRPFHRASSNHNKSEFQALKDVSFEIRQGEIVGIIGPNGAGKSTLLKILSRITEPTTGYADIHGRINSLLEIGTGFHPELTGRENIYLNGAILGMRRTEIRSKFDAIVAFAEIERFLDTPIKHYSSGMYVRLAFAVAAHLEPEILLVDEVLAVGDLSFQKKCLGKMDSVSKQGRTILFVSHNMNAIQHLCPKSMLLSHGRVQAFGNTASVVERYLCSTTRNSVPGDWNDMAGLHRDGTGKVRFEAVLFRSPNPTIGYQPYPECPLEFLLMISSDRPRSVDSIAVTLYDRYGTKLINADTLALGKPVSLREGRNVIQFNIDELHLNPGTYSLGLWAADPPKEVYDFISSAIPFEVVERDAEMIRVQGDGFVPCKFEWQEIRGADAILPHLPARKYEVY
jgi:ABC-type polysaccharide/polyol phosphate transport system ATPase subunit